MKQIEIEKSDLLKLKELKCSSAKKEFSVIHVNTNGGVGGGNFKVIGEIEEKPDALGMVKVKLPVSKEFIKIHPSWISSIRTAKVYHNGTNGFICHIKSYFGKKSNTYVYNGKCDVHIVEEWDSI